MNGNMTESAEILLLVDAGQLQRIHLQVYGNVQQWTIILQLQKKTYLTKTQAKLLSWNPASMINKITV